MDTAFPGNQNTTFWPSKPSSVVLPYVNRTALLPGEGSFYGFPWHSCSSLQRRARYSSCRRQLLAPVSLVNVAPPGCCQNARANPHTSRAQAARSRVCQVGLRIIPGCKESGGDFPRRSPGHDQRTSRQPRGRPRRDPEGGGTDACGRMRSRTRSKPSGGWGIPALEAAAGRTPEGPESLTTAAGEVEYHDPGRRVATPAQNAKLKSPQARG